MRLRVKALALVTLIILIPTGARAQAVIAGSVRDTSGAVLPGVTVEATSPALIEKVRAAISDGSGQYRIEDLRPGVYKVSFSLPGFSTFEREGVELTGSFTATINADMRVGALEETVTVTGESPIVDVQSARRQTVVDNEVLTAIPTARSYNAIVVIVPGVVTNTNDVQTGTATTQFPIHGGRNNEGRMTVDGLNIGNPPGGNQPPGYSVDVGNSQEITFTTSGGLGESETGGLVMNIVPKTGGNTFSGSFSYTGSGKNLQSDNSEGTGIGAPTPLTSVYDWNAAVGGPILKDRVWFFATARTQGGTRVNANQFYNLNAGDSTKWTFAPDSSKPGFSDRTWENVSGRITWQATPRNKIGGFWDEQWVCRTCEGNTIGITTPPVVAPEANGRGQTLPLRVPQVTWSSPVTNRLLLDAGLGGTYYGWGNFENDPNPTRDLIRVTEQCAAGCAANGNRPGVVYRSQDWGTNRTGSYIWKGALSYITGTHSLKIGYQRTLMTDDRTWSSNTQNLGYRFNNGVPNQLTQTISPWVNDGRAGWHAVFAQEQWTLGRLTLQGALRFDIARSWFPAQKNGPTRFLPVAYDFPETKGIDSYKDITPRIGVAYDVFGNGRTALKVNLGKYLEGVGFSTNYANSNPTLRIPRTTGPFGVPGVTRTWTDANGNFQPDCDLLSPLANDRRASGGDFCGQMSNTAFGQNVVTGNYDPDVLNGWGVRPSDWSLGVSIQQQLATRMSIEVGYYRRWFSGFTLSDNLAAQASDYTSYSITAPQDPRLPGGGGYTIPGLYDIVPALFGEVNELTTQASKYGEWYQVLQRRGHHAERAGPERTHFPGWDKHGTERRRQLRRPSQPARTQRGNWSRACRVHRQHDQSVLPRGVRVADAASRTRVLQHPEDRHAGERGLPKQTRAAVGGQLRGAGGGRRAVTGARAIGQRAERHGESHRAGYALWRPHQPARLSRRTELQVRQNTTEGRRRSLERPERQPRADLQPDLRSQRHLASGELNPDWALRENQRGVYLVGRQSLRPGPRPGTGRFTTL